MNTRKRKPAAKRKAKRSPSVRVTAKRKQNTASLSASELEHRIDALEKAYLVATDKEEKKFILKKIEELGEKLEKVYALNEKAFKSNPRKRRTKRNPQYSLEAKPDARVRSMTHEFKVPTKTLANLAMRGYVQEQGGGNPNAYSYKLTKLGLAKWRVEAVPKIKAAKATVKAFTAGSATRKFKRTLRGPKNMYEVSVQRNPKGKPLDWTQASEGFQGQRKSIESDAVDVILRRSGGSGYTRIYFNDVFDDLREEGHSVADIKQALLNLSRAGKVVLMSFDDPNEARRLKQRYSISSGGRDNQFLRYRNPVRRKSTKAKKKAAKTRKRKNSPSDFALAGRISRQIAALEKKRETVATKAQIKKLQAYFAKIFERAEAARQKEVSEVWAAPRSFSTKKRVGGGVRKKKANPRKQKSAVRAKKKNSFVGSIKKTVKKIFKKKNDGSADREDFAGKVSGFKDLYFPPGTPQGLSTLGPLVHIETDKANIKPAKGMAVLCQDGDHRLYVGSMTPDAAAYTGSESLKNQNLGKVQRIEYRCSKPHLGEQYRGNITWYHDFEAPLPTLKTDSDGRFIFSGGNYSIKREGIVG